MNFRVRDVAVWIKNNPVPQVRKVKFAQASEMAVVLSKEGSNQFQWQNGYHPNYKKVPIVCGHERLKDENGNTLHMTQKPEKIIRWLMDYHCMPGGLVLDPFSGTGTMAVEAIRSGRQYICVEREPKYYEASLQRIAIIQPDLLPVDYKSDDYKRRYL
jgi:site-specific DNA-methyltransferase (adenine-specific)